MKIRKLALSLLVIFVFSAAAFATAQYPDKLIWKGKTYDLHSNPLEPYFEKNPDKRPRGDVTSSALWRGYVATFEIRNGELILNDISVEVSKKTDNGSFDTEWRSAIRELVPEGETLKIDWFSGLLVIPKGKLVSYVHMGYGSVYENYTLIEVDRGDFVKSRDFDHKQYEAFKERQFEAFKKTDEYKELVKKIKKDDPDSTDEFIDSFLRSFVISYSSKILVD